MESNRWWEMYLVRYITGSVVGAVIVYIILRKLNVDWFPDLNKIQSSNLVVLASLGFAYCYIASAPITLLHAARFLLDTQLFVQPPTQVMTGVVGWKKFFASLRRWFGKYDWLVLSLLLFVTLFGVLLGFVSNETTWVLVAASTFVLAYTYVVSIKLYFKLQENDEWQKWYFSLAEKREKANSNAGKGFVESYRHLREHGNAFFIISLEISLGIVLYQIATLLQRFSSENAVIWAVTVLAALLYWVLPGALCWYLGNKLERYLVEKP